MKIRGFSLTYCKDGLEEFATAFEVFLDVNPELAFEVDAFNEVIGFDETVTTEFVLAGPALTRDLDCVRVIFPAFFAYFLVIACKITRNPYISL